MRIDLRGRAPSLSTILFFFGALALVMAAAVIYGPALSFPPQFDDYANVVENRAIRYLSHPRVFLESVVTRSRPLTHVTYALNYQIDGLSMSGLRGANVLLHLGTALLVGLLFRRWYRGRGAVAGALLAAGLFLLAPLSVESVVFLSARSSILALFFILLALWFQGVKRPDFWSWAAFHLAAVAAFFSKESAITLLPLLILSHRTAGKRWGELWSYLILLVLGGAVQGVLKVKYLTSAYRGFYHIQGDLAVQGAGEFLRLNLSLWPQILRSLVDPRVLSIDHAVILPADFADPMVLAGIAIWGCGLVVLLAWIRRPTLALMAVLWPFAALAATNSVWPVLDPHSERHFYAAIPALGWGIAAMLGAMGRGPLWAGFLLWPLLTHASAQRALVWQSERSLWMDAYQKYPAKMRIAYNAWSHLYRESGETAPALAIARDFLLRYPVGSLSQEQQDLVVHGAAFLLRGEGSASGADATKIRNGLGALRDTFVGDLVWLEAMIGRVHGEEWLAHWRRTLARHEGVGSLRDPHYGRHQWQMTLARFYLAENNFAGALAAYESVEKVFPDRHSPYWNIREPLGDLYARAGRLDEALAQYEKAAYQFKMFKRFPYGLHEKIYEIYVARHDWHRASDALGEMVRVWSDDEALRKKYALALEKAGHKNALRQKREAAYYERFRVPSTSEKEYLRP